MKRRNNRKKRMQSLSRSLKLTGRWPWRSSETWFWMRVHSHCLAVQEGLPPLTVLVGAWADPAKARSA